MDHIDAPDRRCPCEDEGSNRARMDVRFNRSLSVVVLVMLLDLGHVFGPWVPSIARGIAMAAMMMALGAALLARRRRTS